MPVDFLTDEQASAYAHFVGAPSQTELERFFFLDDADRSVAEKRRAMQTAWGSGSSSGRSASWARSSRTPWTSPPK